MRVEFVWGVLPVFIRQGEPSKGIATVQGPYIVLGETADAGTYRHEIVHVKQFYALLTLIAISAVATYTLTPFASALAVAVGLWRMTDHAQFVTEAAAYAQSAKWAQWKADFAVSDEEVISKYAKILSASDAYSHGRSFDECRKQIAKRFKDGRFI